MPVEPSTPEVRDFLRHLADERQLSPNTVKAYARDVGQVAGKTWLLILDDAGRLPWT